jgi:hypothetical protein
MPLRALDDWDSEQPVLNSLLAAWAVRMTGYLNRTLPRETYRTYPDVISGLRIGMELPAHEGPPPTASGITVLEDVCEVHVMQPGAQLRPVGIVMFVRLDDETTGPPPYRVSMDLLELHTPRHCPGSCGHGGSWH